MGFDMPIDEEPDKEEYEQWEKEQRERREQWETERPGWNVGDDIFFLVDDDTRVVCCKVIEVSEYDMVSEELPRLQPDCMMTISSSRHPRAFHRYEDAAIQAIQKIEEKRLALLEARRCIVAQAVNREQASQLTHKAVVKIFEEVDKHCGE